MKTWWWVIVLPWLACVVLFVAVSTALVEDQTLAVPKGRRESRFLPDVAVVVHTTEERQRYWAGFRYSWQKYGLSGLPVVWITDRHWEDDQACVTFASGWPGPFRVVPEPSSGGLPWSARVGRALGLVAEPFVLWMKEDMWLTRPVQFAQLNRALKLTQRHAWNVMKLYPECTHQVGPATPDHHIVSHQPSLWRRDYLLSTLHQEKYPHQHQTRLNLHLHARADEAAKCQCFSDFRGEALPYLQVSHRGRVSDAGKSILRTARLPIT